MSARARTPATLRTDDCWIAEQTSKCSAQLRQGSRGSASFTAAIADASALPLPPLLQASRTSNSPLCGSRATAAEASRRASPETPSAASLERTRASNASLIARADTSCGSKEKSGPPVFVRSDGSHRSDESTRDETGAAEAEAAFSSDGTDDDDRDDDDDPTPGSRGSLPSSSETRIPISPINLEPPASFSAISASAAARSPARLLSAATSALPTPTSSRPPASTGSVFPPVALESASAVRESHGRALVDQEPRVLLMRAPTAASSVETALLSMAPTAARSIASAERRGPAETLVLLVFLMPPLKPFFVFSNKSSTAETAVSPASAAAPSASDLPPHASRATASAAATEAETASCFAAATYEGYEDDEEGEGEVCCRASASAVAASTRSCKGVLMPSSREGRKAGGDEEEFDAAAFNDDNDGKPSAFGGGAGRPAATCFVFPCGRVWEEKKRKKR